MRLFLTSLFFLLPLNVLASNVVDVSQLKIAKVSNASPPTSIELGQEVIRGVTARAKLVPLATPAETLNSELKQFMLVVEFVKSASGEAMTSGQIAVRIFGTDKKDIQTRRLEIKDDRWSTLLSLKASGETLIKVGTKLDDGKKRIYRFFYNTPKREASLPPEAVPPIN